jgi:mRNA interferase MazF
MKRGDIWTVAGGKDYAGKPRPVVIVQDDSFDATDSITICAFTTDETDAPLVRLLVEPNNRNGLRLGCRMMVDKITTVPKSKVGAQVGRLDDEDILRPSWWSSDWPPRQGSAEKGERDCADAGLTGTGQTGEKRGAITGRLFSAIAVRLFGRNSEIIRA